MLKKLSLAAVIAMGTMSVASATPLTQAIKNVNFGGYLRLRVYNHSKNVGYKNNRYRTTALFKFSVPVNENLKFNTAYAFDWDIYGTGGTLISGDSHPNNVKFFLQYNKNKLTALVGKIPVPTPVTATGVGEATAAGAIVEYALNKNLTFAAAGLDDLVNTDQVGVGGANTIAGAALYSQKNLKASLWGFYIKDIIDSDIVASVTYSQKQFTVHADFATASLNDKVATTATSLPKTLGNKTDTSKTQTYFNVNAKFAQDQMCAKIGYAATGKNGGIVTLDVDSPLSAVTATQQIYSITDAADTSMVYGKIGYMADKKTSFYLAAALINDESSKKVNDYTVGVKYAYTPKMHIHVYYDMLNADSGNAFNKSDNNEARVEFKYTF